MVPTKLMAEKELLGLFISDHPLKDYQKQLNGQSGISQIKELLDSKKKSMHKISGIVVKTQKIITKTGKNMAFSIIEDLSSKIEVVVFPSVYEQQPDAFNENTILIVSGKLDNRDGVPKFLAEDVRMLAVLA